MNELDQRHTRYKQGQRRKELLEQARLTRPLTTEEQQALNHLRKIEHEYNRVRG